MVLRPGKDGLPLSRVQAYAGPGATGLVVFKEVDGGPRVTYAFIVEDLNVKPPPDRWGAHDMYYPFPPPPASGRRSPAMRTPGRRTPVGRRERSRSRERSRGRRSPRSRRPPTDAHPVPALIPTVSHRTWP